MANISISTNTSTVQIDFLPDGKPTVSSKEVALRFQKKHKDVLREINRIRSMVPKSFHERNFAPMFIDVEIGNGAVRKDPAFRLTRDGFSLLAMGFTGKAAVMWKLRYIEAFNALEAAILANTRADALQEGITLQKRMTPERRQLARKAAKYRAKGLNNTEIATLLGVTPNRVWLLVWDAERTGLGA